MKMYKAFARSGLDVWTEIGEDFDPNGAKNLVSGYCFKRKLPFARELTLRLLGEGMWLVEGTGSKNLKFIIVEEEVDYDENEIDED